MAQRVPRCRREQRQPPPCHVSLTASFLMFCVITGVRRCFLDRLIQYKRKVKGFGHPSLFSVRSKAGTGKPGGLLFHGRFIDVLLASMKAAGLRS